MRTILLLTLFIAALAPMEVRAQDEPSASDTTIIVDPAPGTSTLVQPAAGQDGRLEYLQIRSRRARIGLISTAAVTAVGIGLFAGGLTQCDTFVRPGEDDLICSNTGDVLAAVGGTLMFGGIVGMITSGILLGVRNGRVREHRYQKNTYANKPVRWDPERTALVF